jgi:hypothetical protein
VPVMTSAELVFSGLHLPRPLELATAMRFLGRLASDRAAPRIVLEVRADPSGVRHLLGARATDVHALRHMLSDLIPGSVLTTPGQGEQQTRLAWRRSVGSTSTRRDCHYAPTQPRPPPGRCCRR